MMTTLFTHSELSSALPEAPHRLMVDRLEVDTEQCVGRGVKAVSAAEIFFQGHFPGAPILPGVLQIFAMCQVSAMVARLTNDLDVSLLPKLKRLSRTKFRRPVMPGNLMLVETELVSADEGEYVFKAHTKVDDAVACSATLTLVFRPPETPRRDVLISELPEIPESDSVVHVEPAGVLRSIPHRFPFLFVDDAWVHGQTAVGYKNISSGEPYMLDSVDGTFPEHLQLEAAAQTGCACVLGRPEMAGKLAYFMSIDHAEFHAPAVPGDQLVMLFVVTERGRFGVSEGKLYAGGCLAAEVTMKFAVVDSEA